MYTSILESKKQKLNVESNKGARIDLAQKKEPASMKNAKPIFKTINEDK